MNCVVHLRLYFLTYLLSGFLFITESRLLQSPADTVQLSLFHSVTTSALLWSDQQIKILYTYAVQQDIHTRTATFSLSIYLLSDTRVVSISWLLWMMNAAVNTAVQITSEVWFSFPLDLYPGMGLLEHMLLVSHFLRSHHTVFHKPTLIYIFIYCRQGFYSLHILITTIFVVIFITAISQVWDDICSLIQFLWWFMVLNTIFHIPAGNLCVFFWYASCSFSNRGICFLGFELNSSHILDINTYLISTWFVKIFSHSTCCHSISWLYHVVCRSF